MRDEVRYLLHLWNDGGQEQAWRASLTELRSKNTTMFATPEALYTFLNERTLRKSQNGPLTGSSSVWPDDG